MPDFDESVLQESVARLPVVGRRAFAASCATRAIGGFAYYAKEAAAPGLETLHKAAEFVWANIFSGAASQAYIDECERLLSTDSEAWEWHRPWAQGATLGMIAALRTLVQADTAVAIQPAI